ncbi:hypothetical protein C3747_242g35 [Trypanosoma cruzi]|uniref:Uncharacterized protein n=1 Tax=Trypanosoma cruzi TaxID=5693 RepID=A0A2V2VQR8_TRYCR|nr:hypothetical protein C3747_242g35 [Trypanosoma cruzi]
MSRRSCCSVRCDFYLSPATTSAQDWSVRSFSRRVIAALTWKRACRLVTRLFISRRNKSLTCLKMLSRLAITRTFARVIDTMDARVNLTRAATIAIAKNEKAALGWIAMQMGVTLENYWPVSRVPCLVRGGGSSCSSHRAASIALRYLLLSEHCLLGNW